MPKSAVTTEMPIWVVQQCSVAEHIVSYVEQWRTDVSQPAAELQGQRFPWLYTSCN